MWQITSKIFLGNSNDGKANAPYRQIDGVWRKNENSKYLTLNVAHDLFVPADAHIGLVDGAGNHFWIFASAIYTLAEMAENTSAHVLVYCHEGRSRSVSIIAAYLKKCQRYKTLDACYEHIARVRPDIAPNEGLVKDLQKYIREA